MADKIKEIMAELPRRDALPVNTPALRKHYLRTYYAAVPPQELEERSARDLAGSAISHLEQAAAWRRGGSRVRVFNPSLKRDGWESTHTIVQAVTLDRP